MNFRAKLLIALFSLCFLSTAQAQNFERMLTQDWSWGDLLSGNKSSWESLRAHLNNSEDLTVWCNDSNSISIRTERYQFNVEKNGDGTFRRSVTQSPNANGRNYSQRVDRQNYHEYIFRELIPVAQSCGIGGGINASVNRQLLETRRRVKKNELPTAVLRALPGRQANE